MFCVGTMSSGIGWETKSVDNAMNLHFYYWFVARENQSKVIGQIPSFYSVWKRFGEKKEELKTNVQQLLTLYMKELFDDVTVTVNDTPVNNTVSLYNLAVVVKVKVDGITYSLAKAIEIRPDNFNLLEKHRLG